MCDTNYYRENSSRGGYNNSRGRGGRGGRYNGGKRGGMNKHSHWNRNQQWNQSRQRADNYNSSSNWHYQSSSTSYNNKQYGGDYKRHLSPPPLPPRPPMSPPPGSEEARQRETDKISALIKKQLEQPEDTDFTFLTSELSRREASDINNRYLPASDRPNQSTSTMTRKPSSPKRSSTVSSCPVAAAAMSNVSAHNQKLMNDKNVVMQKIREHISSMSLNQVKSVINSEHSKYDVIFEHFTRQQRQLWSKSLRNMYNNEEENLLNDQGDIRNTIIHDIGIKLEDLPPEVIVEMSNTLDLDMDELTEFSNLDNDNNDRLSETTTLGLSQQQENWIGLDYPMYNPNLSGKECMMSSPSSCSNYSVQGKSGTTAMHQQQLPCPLSPSDAGIPQTTPVFPPPPHLMPDAEIEEECILEDSMSFPDFQSDSLHNISDTHKIRKSALCPPPMPPLSLQFADDVIDYNEEVDNKTYSPSNQENMESESSRDVVYNVSKYSNEQDKCDDYTDANSITNEEISNVIVNDTNHSESNQNLLYNYALFEKEINSYTMPPSISNDEDDHTVYQNPNQARVFANNTNVPISTLDDLIPANVTSSYLPKVTNIENVPLTTFKPIVSVNQNFFSSSNVTSITTQGSNQLQVSQKEQYESNKFNKTSDLNIRSPEVDIRTQEIIKRTSEHDNRTSRSSSFEKRITPDRIKKSSPNYHKQIRSENVKQSDNSKKYHKPYRDRSISPHERFHNKCKQGPRTPSREHRSNLIPNKSPENTENKKSLQSNRENTRSTTNTSNKYSNLNKNRDSKENDRHDARKPEKLDNKDNVSRNKIDSSSHTQSHPPEKIEKLWKSPGEKKFIGEEILKSPLNMQYQQKIRHADLEKSDGSNQKHKNINSDQHNHLSPEKISSNSFYEQYSEELDKNLSNTSSQSLTSTDSQVKKSSIFPNDVRIKEQFNSEKLDPSKSTSYVNRMERKKSEERSVVQNRRQSNDITKRSDDKFQTNYRRNQYRYNKYTPQSTSNEKSFSNSQRYVRESKSKQFNSIGINTSPEKELQPSEHKIADLMAKKDKKETITGRTILRAKRKNIASKLSDINRQIGTAMETLNKLEKERQFLIDQLIDFDSDKEEAPSTKALANQQLTEENSNCDNNLEINIPKSMASQDDSSLKRKRKITETEEGAKKQKLHEKDAAAKETSLDIIKTIVENNKMSEENYKIPKKKNIPKKTAEKCDKIDTGSSNDVNICTKQKINKPTGKLNSQEKEINPNAVIASQKNSKQNKKEKLPEQNSNSSKVSISTNKRGKRKSQAQENVQALEETIVNKKTFTIIDSKTDEANILAENSTSKQKESCDVPDAKQDIQSDVSTMITEAEAVVESSTVIKEEVSIHLVPEKSDPASLTSQVAETVLKRGRSRKVMSPELKNYPNLVSPASSTRSKNKQTETKDNLDPKDLNSTAETIPLIEVNNGDAVSQLKSSETELSHVSTAIAEDKKVNEISTEITKPADDTKVEITVSAERRTRRSSRKLETPELKDYPDLVSPASSTRSSRKKSESRDLLQTPTVNAPSAILTKKSEPCDQKTTSNFPKIINSEDVILAKPKKKRSRSAKPNKNIAKKSNKKQKTENIDSDTSCNSKIDRVQKWIEDTDGKFREPSVETTQSVEDTCILTTSSRKSKKKKKSKHRDQKKSKSKEHRKNSHKKQDRNLKSLAMEDETIMFIDSVINSLCSDEDLDLILSMRNCSVVLKQCIISNPESFSSSDKAVTLAAENVDESTAIVSSAVNSSTLSTDNSTPVQMCTVSSPMVSPSIAQSTDTIPSVQSVVEVQPVSKNASESQLAIADEKTQKYIAEDTVFFEGHSQAILTIKLFNTFVVAGSTDGNVYMYNMITGELLHTFKSENTIASDKNAITSLCIDSKSDTEATIYCGSLNCKLMIYNMFEKICLETIDTDVPIQCMEIAWNMLFIGSSKGELIRYDIAKKSYLSTPGKVCDTNILALIPTTEGGRRVLLLAARNSPVSVRDASSGLLLRSFPFEESPTVYSIVIHDSIVYCGTSQHGILTYSFQDAESKSKVNLDIKGVNCIQMLKHILFAGCYNGSIYVYDTKTNQHLTTINGPGGMLLSMAIRSDKIVVGTKLNYLKAWRIPNDILEKVDKSTP